MVPSQITFLDAGYGPNQPPLVATYFASSDTNSALGTTATVVTVQDGQTAGPASLYLAPRLTPPSPPTDLTVTAVSNSELGLRWNASLFTGGAPATKFLVEWDSVPYFPLGRSNGSTMHAVVNATAARRVGGASGLVSYAYQVRTSLRLYVS